MRATRIYAAGVVLGMTLAGAVWLCTYRVWSIVKYIDRTGLQFHPAERVRVQPWWGVPASVGLVVIGLGVSLWLLPERRRFTERFFALFAKPTDRTSA